MIQRYSVGEWLVKIDDLWIVYLFNNGDVP
jgi:hypothetical protein